MLKLFSPRKCKKHSEEILYYLEAYTINEQLKKF